MIIRKYWSLINGNYQHLPDVFLYAGLHSMTEIAIDDHYTLRQELII